MINKLSASEVMRATGVSCKQNKKVQWHAREIVIKQFITAEEYIRVIQNILSECYTADDEIRIELIDFSIRVNVIAAYAYVELPDNPAELYYISYASGLYELICKYANIGQIESIKETIKYYL